MGEETGTRKPDARRRWVVDPLDGTSNFIWGIPYFAVSIALCDDDGEILGVVLDPLRDEMFTAVRGQGARMNGKELTRLEEKKPEESIISLSMPIHGQLKSMDRTSFFRALDAITNETAGIRRLGSAALDLAYVGAGRLNGYFEDGLSHYDYAAGKIIAQEAGALVTSLNGGVVRTAVHCWRERHPYISGSNPSFSKGRLQAERSHNRRPLLMSQLSNFRPDCS